MRVELSKSDKWKYSLSAAGFCAITGQIVILRRLEVLFGGNELSLAVFFAGWLVWSGTGAFIGRFLNRNRFIALLFLQGLALPASVWIIRIYPVLTGREIGMISGILDIAGGCIILTAPFALLTGMIFTTAIKFSDDSPGKVYFWEALGAGLGGVFVTVCLGWFDSFQLGFIAAGLNIFTAFSSKTLKTITVLIILPLVIWIAPILEQDSLNRFWRNFTLLESAESVYGEIAVVRWGEQSSVYVNGTIAFSYPNPMDSEESAHFPMLACDNPGKVLLIGGGFSGVVDEILKYSSVDTVYYAEIDGKLLEIVGRNFPENAVKFIDDPKVVTVIEDGRGWLKKQRNKFDVIIVDLPDPSTAQLNRYYTREFFREVSHALKADGIFGISLNSSEDFIEDSLADLLKGIENTIQTVFRYSELLPGYKCHFIAGKAPFHLETDTLIQRLDYRNIETVYISKYFLPHRLNREKRDYLNLRIDSNDTIWQNSDFYPRGYLSVLNRWDRQFHPKFHFNLFRELSFIGVISGILIVCLILGFLLKGAVIEKGVRLGLLTGGFSQIGLQLMLLMGFQFIFGYVYFMQSALITMFMVGTAVGSFSGAKWENESFKKRIKALLKIQSAIIILPISVYILLYLAGKSGDIFKYVLTFEAFLCGCAAGLQYTVASGFLKGKTFKTGGGLYGLDLIGASIGSIMTGIILIPVFGFLKTAILLGVCSILPTVLITVGSRKN